jgi:cyanophycinase
VIDSKSANDATLAASILRCKLVYILGGFPRFLADTLAKSVCWQAILDVYKSGGVIAGSSAGAMVLCEYYYDPYEQKILSGLNLIANACVLPHYNNFGKSWLKPLQELLPNVHLLGIDEQTAMFCSENIWQVYGSGTVNISRSETTFGVARGEVFSLK